MIPKFFLELLVFIRELERTMKRTSIWWLNRAFGSQNKPQMDIFR
jgi:hypothetical protein